MKPIAYRLPLTSRDNWILPLGCIHWPFTDRALLKEWLREMKTLKAHTILCGDTFDFARTHFRDFLRSYQADRNSAQFIDSAVKREVAELAKLLKPIAPRIIGVLRGNHHYEMSDTGINSEQLLAQELGTRYLGDTAVIRLDFTDRDETVEHQMTLHAHHGLKSCGSAGADMNDLLKTELEFDADIHVLAHTHRKQHHVKVRRGLTTRGEPKVVESEVAFIRTGTMDGHGQDYEEDLGVARPHVGKYAERGRLGALRPGYVKCRVLVSRDRRAEREVLKGHRFEITS